MNVIIKHYCVGGLCILLSYLCGEYLVIHFAIPLPGALIGMALLFGLMTLSSSLAQKSSLAAQPLLANMSFFFIPAVLGIAIYWSTLQQNLISIILAIVGSTLVSLAFSYWVGKKLLTSNVPAGNNERNS